MNYRLVRSSVSAFGTRLDQIVSLAVTDGLNRAPKPAARVSRREESSPMLTGFGQKPPSLRFKTERPQSEPGEDTTRPEEGDHV